MKITDIQIERYGVWEHLALPLQNAGLNVLYGPNEAGKTTLLRFIRDLLFDGKTFRRSPTAWRGALRLTNGEQFAEVHRSASTDGEGTLDFKELDPELAWSMEPDWADAALEQDRPLLSGLEAEDALSQLCAGTNANLFQHIFAIGLHELQELATLQDEDVARRIYRLSTGLGGRRIVQICSQSDSKHTQVEFPPKIRGRIEELILRDEEIEEELQSLRGQRERHHQLLVELDEITAQVIDDEARLAELKQEIRGHQTLLRVWEPWNQVRILEAEIQSLPLPGRLEELDLAKLDQWEQEIRDGRDERKAAIADYREQLKEYRRRKPTPSQPQSTTEVQGFLTQRQWVVEMERELEIESSRARELKTEYEARRQLLGPDWTDQRLAAVDISRPAYAYLVDAARSFQEAQGKQTTFARRYEKSAATCHKRQSEWDQRISELPEGSLRDAIRATRVQMAGVSELKRLLEKEQALQQKLTVERSQIHRRQEASHVPTWVPSFLMFLTVSGLILSALGFYTGLTSNGITGAILCLVGVAGFAISRGFQIQSETRLEESTLVAQSQIERGEKELGQLQADIAELQTHCRESDAGGRTSAEDFVLALKQRRKELKKLAREGRALKQRRKRLSRMREALKNRQRAAMDARQAWCEALKSIGLEETLAVEDAFNLWQKIAEAREHQRAWKSAVKRANDVQSRHEAFCRRLAELGRSLGDGHLDFNQPLHVLEVWEQRDVNDAREPQTPDERTELKQELKSLRRRIKKLKRTIDAARTSRKLLLAEAGARNRADFLRRRESSHRRRELEETLDLARMELADAAEAAGDLAIVEDDLVNFQQQETQETIDLMQLEIDDLQSRLDEAQLRIEEREQERLELESDRRSAELRFERETISEKLRSCLTDFAAERLAEQTVREIRAEFEQSCQPELLEMASEFLAQLTCGKYQKVWSVLGEESLRIRDREHRSFTVEELSTGTREQLFLALRLALVREYAKQDVHLPMVLDDVLVNFDQYRTEAAIQTLTEFADQGHQVLLLTSHLHVAKICEQQGIDPVWLPAHHAPVAHRRAG